MNVQLVKATQINAEQSFVVCFFFQVIQIQICKQNNQIYLVCRYSCILTIVSKPVIWKKNISCFCKFSNESFLKGYINRLRSKSANSKKRILIKKSVACLFSKNLIK